MGTTEQALEGIKEIVEKSEAQMQEIQRLQEAREADSKVISELRAKYERVAIFEDIVDEAEGKKWAQVTIRNMPLYQKLQARARRQFGRLDTRTINYLVECCLRYSLGNGWSRVQSIIERDNERQKT